jgi:catechol 2,3-dioxygenase-like lactoylglutathione lyase family enzyme
MTDWKKQIAAINLIVDDVEGAKAFYRDVLGVPLEFEDEDSAAFKFGDQWVFLQTKRTDGVGQFAIIVEDVDAVATGLKERGVTVTSGPADRDWGMRTLTFDDPGGTTWEIAQPVPKS